MIDLVWGILQKEIDELKNGLKAVQTLTERAETAGGVASSLLANVPLAADGAGAGDLLWISNGRKVGEGVGAGTGVLAYYNPGTNTWFRTADDTAVLA